MPSDAAPTRKQLATLRQWVVAAKDGRFPQFHKIIVDTGYADGFTTKRITDVARFFGVSAKTFRDWTALRGCPQKNGPGYDLENFVRWRIGYVAQLNQPRQGSADERLKLARASREELRLSRERGAVIDRDRVERIWRQYFTTARTIILGITDRVLALCPAELRGPLRPVIEGTIHSVLKLLQRIPDEWAPTEADG